MTRRSREIPRARRSLRRRVALLFVAAVVVTALALALSAYLITKTTQDQEALDKALTQSRFNLFLADSILPATPKAADYSDLLSSFEIRGNFAALIEAGPDTYFSGLQVTRDLITPELARKVADGRIGYQMIAIGNEPTLAVGAQIRSGELAFFFFYPQGARLAELARLRNTLVTAGAILAALGAIAGYWLARRLLGPVRAASKAAVRMSQGDLDIRLPIGNDELGVLAASFNRMAENLQTKILDLEVGQARERRFVADVTHELRTPVSALVGEASLLKARLETKPNDCPPEVVKLASLVSIDITRLRQLVDDLLEISKLDARAAEAVIEPVDLRPFLDQLVFAHGWSNTVRVIGPGPLEKRAEWIFTDTIEAMPPDMAKAMPAVLSRDHYDYSTILTDKRRIERIVVNLVENALQHGAAPVCVEIALGGAKASEVRVTVTDSGPGIPAEHLPHVFERFYKADPSRSSGRGSGLGLAIARENARLLGGDLVVANAPTAGARFVLALPTGS